MTNRLPQTSTIVRSGIICGAQGEFRQYYNAHRVHIALDVNTPSEIACGTAIRHANLNQFCWGSHCRGLYQLPKAA